MRKRVRERYRDEGREEWEGVKDWKRMRREAMSEPRITKRE